MDRRIACNGVTVGGRTFGEFVPGKENEMALRVVQWTTGNVGKQSAIAIARNPGLELVGCYAWSVADRL
jgi:hypothetical protein